MLLYLLLLLIASARFFPAWWEMRSALWPRCRAKAFSVTQNEKRRDQYSENRQTETERQREKKRQNDTWRDICALCVFSFDVSRSSFSSFPRDDDDLNFPNGWWGRARDIESSSSSRCRCTREEEKHRMERKRERERDKEREKVIRTFFMCACIYARVRALECLCI